MRRERFRVESRRDRRLMLAPPPSDRTGPSGSPHGVAGDDVRSTAPSAAGGANSARRGTEAPDTTGRSGAPPSSSAPPAGHTTGPGSARGAGPGGAGSATGAGGGGVVAVAAALGERTRDLQRLKAEYDNYRGRVHRDRLAVREIAVANVLARLLPVLDAVAEAGRNGELTGGFLRVARQLEDELAALGLAAFGAPGEPFDPRVHEAVAYRVSDGVERPVCAEVVRPGYRVGGQLLRPADVVVTGPPAAR